MTLIIKELPIVGVKRLADLLQRFDEVSAEFRSKSEPTEKDKYTLVYIYCDVLRQYNLLCGFNGINKFNEDDLHNLCDDIMLELARFIVPSQVYALMLNFNNIGLGTDVDITKLYDHLMYLTENEAEAVVIAQSFIIDYELFKQIRSNNFASYGEAIVTTESWMHEWMLKYAELPAYLGVN